MASLPQLLICSYPRFLCLPVDIRILLILGKSSVINALLGKKYLAEGILPTTNEISILK